ncbi:MAG: FadR family transcriptional regulator [Actinobacteria bacterium]|nr:MAG: FadR family transcriptional regulator [Actinomycetota bacterium]
MPRSTRRSSGRWISRPSAGASTNAAPHSPPREPVVSTTGPRFGPIARRTLAETIREQIQQEILDGALPGGARLPSERQLCEDFKVARTSVREAIQGLISLGLVVRRGNRAYVAEELPAFGVEALDARTKHVRELFEVRRVTERAEISNIAEQFDPALPIAEFRELDRSFHWTLARASHNSLLAEVYGKVLAALFESEEWSAMLNDAKYSRAVKGIIKVAGSEHREIAGAIARGDAVGALAGIERHLETVETRIVSQLV